MGGGNPICAADLAELREQFSTLGYEVRASRGRIDYLTSGLPIGFVEVDAAGLLITTNDALHEMVGFDPVIEGKGVFDLVHDEDRDPVECERTGRYTAPNERSWQIIRAEALPVARRDGHWTGELETFHRDGRLVPHLVSITVQRDPLSGLDVTTSIWREITQLKAIDWCRSGRASV